MNHELLVVPERVISIKHVNMSSFGSGSDAVLLIMSNAVAFVNSDGEVISTITSKNTVYGNSTKSGATLCIVDAEYMPKLGSLVLALSDTSLVHVPLSTMGANESGKRTIAANIEAGAFERFIWPSQPVSITAMDSDWIGEQACLVRCQSGLLCVIALSNPGAESVSTTASSSSSSNHPRCPSSTGAPSEIASPIILACAGAGASVCALVGAQNKSGKGKQSAHAHRLFFWQAAKGWLTEQTASITGVALESTEQVLSLCFASISSALLVMQVKNRGTRLLKMALNDGDNMLFSRHISDAAPMHTRFLASASGGDGSLLMLGADGQLQQWCCRYGAAGAQWSFGEASEASDKKASGGVTNAMDSLYCLGGTVDVPVLYRMHREGGGSSLVQVTLTGGSIVARTGLARALGSLKDLRGKTQTPLVIQLFTERETADIESPAAGGRGALGALPRPLKRKLQNAAQWRSKRSSDEEENEGEDHCDKRFFHSPKVRVAAPYVPLEASYAFLQALRGRSPGDVLAADWDVLLTLLTTHRCVSIQMPNNSDMIDLALKSGRLDVLCCLARYAPDMTERQAIYALVQLARWDANSADNHNALSCLHISPSGVLSWTTRSHSDLSNANSVSNGKKKGKRAAAATPAAVTTATAGQLSHLDVLQALSESLLRRNGAFSSTLLADAARDHVNNSVAALLLRIFLQFLRGLSRTESSKATSFQGYVHDTQVSRAVTWCEALLDAHFCDVALSMGSGNGTLALQAALRDAGAFLPAKGVEAGAAMAEQALGIWTHVHRTLRVSKERGSTINGVVNLSPPEGPYRLERVVF